VDLTVVEAGLAKVDTASTIVEMARTAVGGACAVAAGDWLNVKPGRTVARGEENFRCRGRAGFRLSAKKIFDNGFTPLPGGPSAAMLGVVATVPSAVNMISPTRHYDCRP
jgi:hypothetical protein